MGFGYRQRKNPTPSVIEFWCKVISVVSAVIITWLQTVDFMSTQWVHIISSILGLLVVLSNALAPFFGKEIKTASVPKEKVTAIDEAPITKPLPYNKTDQT